LFYCFPCCRSHRILTSLFRSPENLETKPLNARSRRFADACLFDLVKEGPEHFDGSLVRNTAGFADYQYLFEMLERNMTNRHVTIIQLSEECVCNPGCRSGGCP